VTVLPNPALKTDAMIVLRGLYNTARMVGDVKLMTRIASAISDLRSGDKEAALQFIESLPEVSCSPTPSCNTETKNR
jgi:hypothetical protein